MWEHFVLYLLISGFLLLRTPFNLLNENQQQNKKKVLGHQCVTEILSLIAVCIM